MQKSKARRRAAKRRLKSRLNTTFKTKRVGARKLRY